MAFFSSSWLGTAKGKCPVCSRHVSLTSSGNLVPHSNRAQKSPRCDGAGRQPAQGTTLRSAGQRPPRVPAPARCTWCRQVVVADPIAGFPLHPGPRGVARCVQGPGARRMAPHQAPSARARVPANDAPGCSTADCRGPTRVRPCIGRWDPRSRCRASLGRGGPRRSSPERGRHVAGPGWPTTWHVGASRERRTSQPRQAAVIPPVADDARSRLRAQRVFFDRRYALR